MAAPRTFSRRELETRNKKDDALLVIDNLVYDVTPFLDEHPGGHEVLMDRAGKDASENFADVGHSADAKELMKKFLVGELVPADRAEPALTREARLDGAQDTADGGGAWAVWLPPLALGLLATLLYTYLF